MKPLVLCILDGVGIREETYGNAVYKANMPVFEHLLNTYPNCLLDASGKSVGLPDGQMGNSEVGHTNIGAGRVVKEPLEIINEQIDNGAFFDNDKLLSVMDYTKIHDSKLHIMGLLSDGGIHSHIDHLYALLKMCKDNDIKEVYLHLFLDGRDTLPSEGMKYLNRLTSKINELDLGTICTISGRYYAMDRDNNYDRLEKAYNAIVNGDGEKYDNYVDAIRSNQKRNITDEFTVPCVINEGKIEDNDGVIVYNFRPDRLRELCSCLTNPKFKSFPHNVPDIKLVTFMPVASTAISTPAFDLPTLDNTFGEYISSKGLTQLRIAETEKYAHVTYFFDGGVERKIKGIKKVLIPSPKVATYDMKPEMSAYKVTNALLKQISNFDVVILNFANGDMVGHTGKMDATIKALEVVDECLGKIYDKVEELGGTLVVTADHGNSDYMLDKDGNEVTSHSTSRVPLIITKKGLTLHNGKLADIAPTLLTLMDLSVPFEMTGDILTRELKPVMIYDKYDKHKKVSHNDIKAIKELKDNEESNKEKEYTKKQKKQAKEDKKKLKALKKQNDGKKRSKFNTVFNILSIIFIVGFVGIYGYRFVHYYKEAHTTEEYKQTNIIDKLDEYKVKTKGSGLYECDSVKCFKGLVANNYLYYNGLLWRIVSYDSESVKLLSEESLTIMRPSYDGTNYIDKWLDNFKSKLSMDYITGVSLLTSDEYNNTVLGDSYLNNSTSWYTKDDKFVSNDGKVTDVNDDIHSIRVSITLNNTPTIISGTGTSTDPYTIISDTSFYLKDVNIGTYISFSNHLWRVIDKDDDDIELACEDLLDSYPYSTKNSSYNIYEKGSIGYYLNNDFYKSLDTTSIKSHKWNIITYNSTTKYNYKKVSKTVTANIGLLNVGDLFINDVDGYDLMTEENTTTLYKVNPNGTLYMDLKTSSNKVRPAIVIDGNLVINSGTGFKNSPYKIGE